ncbi:carboxymuconolactone decarboxylase family protein [Rhizobium sp. LC145]|jgi:4-carboxymuconolactone decarboxylase|uniref:carboxymuconolactone decarboxylase family protein n=2 Tax=Rhizobiaceae TaxID=82115 RepID=UPI000629EAF5|nr:carboxymuconolactone decarboxylase family protein [Rhizobium sp. LC145]KKX23737.1 4-carboxymuconolactone decarboxylase [Rhizobium sp. LC145]KNY30823.1 4-carboxymuconolactone decarboxylase [Agrobacterium sp. SUL3]TKT42640.1 carboxymuconolactone decarboxylase family protein [Rhizobiaceae bacterium LC148]
MKRLAAILITAGLTTGPALAQERTSIMADDIQRVAPALGAYTQDGLFAKVWQGADLSARDRALVTVAILITRNQTGELEDYIARALDAGVTPAEMSEAITHLAFYAGWGNAMAAVEAAADVYEERGVGADALPPVKPEPLPLDEEAENARQTQVQGNFGSVSQGVVDNTENFLFRDLWLRPDLKPRDRSLITVVALIASGQVAQMPYHLNRAMDNGLTREEVGGVLAHAAFYTGWPNVFTALPVAKEVLEKRSN